MSQERRPYTFNTHRDALYQVLEATARGEPGCAVESDVFEERVSKDDKKKCAECSSPYPIPLLWYNEIRPSDLDAYHAAVHASCTGGCTTNIIDRDHPQVHSSSAKPPTSGRATNCPSANRSRFEVLEDAAAHQGAAVFGGGLLPVVTSAAVAPSSDAPESGITSVRHVRGEKQARRSGTLTMMPEQHSGATARNHQLFTIKQRDRYWPDGSTVNTIVQEERIGEDEKEKEKQGEATTKLPIADSNGSSSKTRYNHPSASATPATSPPDPSQATQTTTLPGLPSQVLLTQQKQQQLGDGEAWGHSEGDESSQDESSSAAGLALSLPDRRYYSSEGNLASTVASGAAGGGEGPLDSYSLGNRSRSERNPFATGNDHIEAVTEGATRKPGEDGSRRNRAFTNALTEFAGQQQPDGGGGGHGAGSTESAQGQIGGGGVDDIGGVPNNTNSVVTDQPIPPVTFVSTDEVLPSAWLGGQAAAVAFLEEHLSHVRKQCPGGYAARSLELACHVLRQPSVCVKAVEYRKTSLEGTRASGVLFPGRLDHPQVVGVAGFVWELLHKNVGGQVCRIGERAPSPSRR